MLATHPPHVRMVAAGIAAFAAACTVLAAATWWNASRPEMAGRAPGETEVARVEDRTATRDVDPDMLAADASAGETEPRPLAGSRILPPTRELANPPLDPVASTGPAGDVGPPVASRAAPPRPGSLPRPETRRSIDADGLVRRHQGSVAMVFHPSSSGTGFVVAENLIATNAHVVEEAPADEIEVYFLSSSPAPVQASRVVYEDVGRDLCLVEVETSQPPLEVVAEFGVPQGEPVVLIGNPSVAMGVIATNAATVGEMAGGMRVGKAFFHSVRAAVNPGSSGGPVLDSEGRVVGVVAMKATDEGARALRTALAELDPLSAARSTATGGRPAGFAFAIPSSDLHRAIEEVRERSDADRARADDVHLARVLLARLSRLGALHVVSIQAHAPAGVRREAARLQMETIRTEAMLRSDSVPPRDRRRAEQALKLVKERSFALVPEHIADQLRAELESGEVRAMRESYETDLDAHVVRLRASDHLSETTRSALSHLFQLVRRAGRSAEKYAGGGAATYVQFANDLKVREELRTAVESLGKELEAAGP